MSDNELDLTHDDIERQLATPPAPGYSVPISNDYLRKRFGPLGDNDCILTNQRAECSRGLPVLVVRGTAYGPGDLPGLVLRLVPSLADPARRAGWTVEEYEPEWRQQERED